MPQAFALAAALESGPVVLDGGLATQLEATGYDLSDELWSARLLADAPDAIVAVHRAYLSAGARVITTASYQASLAGLRRRGWDSEALLERSVALAREAAAGRKGPLWIAASVGPYGATLADGSEYRGNYGLSHADLVRFHRPRMEILAAAGPDLFALETVPDVLEAEAMLEALDGLGIAAWLSYTVDRGRTRAGQPLTEAFAVARGRCDIIAVGVNCSDPADATAAVTVAAEASGKPVVVYPNSGEYWDARTRQWTGRPVDPVASAARWVADGARLVGGCCRVSPAAIADLARALAG
jgi:S-methylmethionine-dependent homocysteine/selenocysteine methylase